MCEFVSVCKVCLCGFCRLFVCPTVFASFFFFFFFFCCFACSLVFCSCRLFVRLFVYFFLPLDSVGVYLLLLLLLLLFVCRFECAMFKFELSVRVVLGAYFLFLLFAR